MFCTPDVLYTVSCFHTEPGDGSLDMSFVRGTVFVAFKKCVCIEQNSKESTTKLEPFRCFQTLTLQKLK